MSRTDRNVAQKMKVLSKKRWICGIKRVISPIAPYPNPRDPTNITQDPIRRFHFLVLLFFRECSQILTTFHPWLLRFVLTLRSLFRFFLIFFDQYSRLPFGILKCLLHPCQKQLSKKMPIFFLRQTASGTPSMSLG